jgi:hypothetical protein
MTGGERKFFDVRHEIGSLGREERRPYPRLAFRKGT